MVIAIAVGGWALFETKQSAPDLPIEMIAFNSLTEEETSSLIIVSPKDSQVEKVAVNDKIEALITKNYNKRKVYKITFNQTATESHGNLIVFVDTDKKTVVGKGFDGEMLATLK